MHRAHVIVTGRIASRDAEAIDIEGIARAVYRSAGYSNGWYPSPDEIRVDNHLCLGPLEAGEAEFRALSDDQAICIGFANNLVQTNHLPVEHWLAQTDGSSLQAEDGKTRIGAWPRWQGHCVREGRREFLVT